MIVLLRTLSLCLVGFLFVGCFKSPKTVSSPGMKVDYTIVDNKEVYTINFSGVLRNENNDKAMKNVEGSIGILDSSKGLLISIPFSIDVIMPLSAATLYLKVEKTDDEMSPLLDYFQIDREELIKTGTNDGQPLDENSIVLEKLTFEKKDIINLLKEKI